MDNCPCPSCTLRHCRGTGSRAVPSWFQEMSRTYLPDRQSRPILAGCQLVTASPLPCPSNNHNALIHYNMYSTSVRSSTASHYESETAVFRKTRVVLQLRDFQRPEG